MKPIKRFALISALSIGTVGLFTAFFVSLNNGLSQSYQLSDRHEEIVSELAQINIIYLGETHNNPEDHKAQLEIIKALYLQNSQIAIALEMFERPYQKFLDSYLAGKIDEIELREKTEYDQRWGFDWELYAPILRFAKINKLPLLALNTPSEISTKVARQGLDSLTLEERRYIPPISEIRSDNQEYRQMLLEVYQQHAHGGKGNSKDFERFLTVQLLWDETMAEKIAQFWQANPNNRVVVLAGRGHIIYGYGIPDRVARRLNTNLLKQRKILFGPPLDIKFNERNPPADYFWDR
jgi:uncharacterized iron-regulated protein